MLIMYMKLSTAIIMSMLFLVTMGLPRPGRKAHKAPEKGRRQNNKIKENCHSADKRDFDSLMRSMLHVTERDTDRLISKLQEATHITNTTWNVHLRSGQAKSNSLKKILIEKCWPERAKKPVNELFKPLAKKMKRLIRRKQVKPLLQVINEILQKGLAYLKVSNEEDFKHHQINSMDYNQALIKTNELNTTFHGILTYYNITVSPKKPRNWHGKYDKFCGKCKGMSTQGCRDTRDEVARYWIHEELLQFCQFSRTCSPNGQKGGQGGKRRVKGKKGRKNGKKYRKNNPKNTRAH